MMLCAGCGLADSACWAGAVLPETTAADGA